MVSTVQRNALTIDVEEYYHVGRPGEEPFGNGRRHPESRVEADVARVLDLLAAHDARATFFIVGEIARAHPGLAGRIAERGHEVACHGDRHVPVDAMSRREFEEDLDRAVATLSSEAGVRPAGFRAPIWSLPRAPWGVEALVSRGFVYDSSFAPVPPFGGPGMTASPSILTTSAGEIREMPPLTARLGPWRYPVGFALGLRALPMRAILRAIGAENRRGRPATISFHSWELDPEPPALRLRPSLNLAHAFRLEAMPDRMTCLLRSVRFAPVRELLTP